MAQPQMPHIPGAAVMNDTLDFMKNLWGSMGVPGLTAPTLSVEELDKKINDLKAVEAWLNLNMSMLRGSIQALEVQRGTIATLKSVGASLAAAVHQGGDNKSLFDANPYASAFFQHAREAGQKAPAAATSAAPPPPPPAAPAPSATAGTAGATAAPPSATDKPQADPTAGAAALWWNLLQDQFKQAVSTAVASESMMADAAARATETAVKFATATAVKPEAASSAQAEKTNEANSGEAAAADKKPAAPRRTPAKATKPTTGK